MALAILRQDDEQGEGVGFTFDIGKIRFWTLAVGASRRRGRSGLEVVDEVGFSTPLEGPLPASALGRGRLLVPAGAFDREQRLVQLASYRDPERRGPALSDILELGGNIATGRLPPSDELPDLAPPRRFARDLSRRTGVMARTIPMHYREGRLSEAAGIEAIGSLLQTILPQVTRAVDALAPAIQRLAPAVADLLGGTARTALAPTTNGASPGTNGAAGPPARLLRPRRPAHRQQRLSIATRRSGCCASCSSR
jgi:hypothetical protein